MRHCKICGQPTEECWCADEDEAAQDPEPYGWAGQGFPA